MSIYLTALIKSKPGSAEALKECLQGLVPLSRKEVACLQYNLHQSVDDPNVFIFQEEWADKEGLEFHNAQAYILSFRETIVSLIDGPVVIHHTQKAE
jgi:quinol monooxygenase YgiN